MASCSASRYSGPSALPQVLELVEIKLMSIFNKVTKTFQWGQHKVTMETGEIARQSGGAVMVDMDGTVVLATVVAKADAKPGCHRHRRGIPPAQNPGGPCRDNLDRDRDGKADKEEAGDLQ